LKKASAILIFCLLTFNWIGYKLVTYCLQKQSDTRLEAAFDQDNYDGSELISLKLAAPHLTLYSNCTSFERVDGQVEIDGIQYKFVKRRYFDDSLEFLCIANHLSMKLQVAGNDFYKLVNDLPGNQGKRQSPGSSSQKSFSTDYYSVIDAFGTNPLVTELFIQQAKFLFSIPNRIRLVLDHPPQIQA
jgi:hypothetical protein